MKDGRTVGKKIRCASLSSRVIPILLLVLAFSRPALSGEIHDAARSGNLEKVRELLVQDPGLVFSRDDISWTPLHCAAAYGHRDVAQLPLANKAEVDARDDLGGTPLHVAAVNGNTGKVGLEALGRDHYGIARCLRFDRMRRFVRFGQPTNFMWPIFYGTTNRRPSVNPMEITVFDTPGLISGYDVYTMSSLQLGSFGSCV